MLYYFKTNLMLGQPLIRFFSYTVTSLTFFTPPSHSPNATLVQSEVNHSDHESYYLDILLCTYLCTYRYVITTSVLLLHKYVFTTCAMINNKPVKPLTFLILIPVYEKILVWTPLKKNYQTRRIHLYKEKFL